MNASTRKAPALLPLLPLVFPLAALADTPSGFDASHFQSAVDFNEIGRSAAHFTFLKATQGADLVDPTYRPRLLAARNAGIKVGAYHFYEPAEPPEPQLRTFLGNLDWRPGDLPPVVDIELPLQSWRSSGKSISTHADDRLVRDLQCFLGSIELSLGVTPIVYSGEDYASDYLRGVAHYPLWLAEYRRSDAPQLPAGWPGWLFWQYTQNGRLHGVDGDVDLDRFNGTADTLERLAGHGHSLRTTESIQWASGCEHRGTGAVGGPVAGLRNFGLQYTRNGLAAMPQRRTEADASSQSASPELEPEPASSHTDALPWTQASGIPSFLKLLVHTHAIGLLMERMQSACAREINWAIRVLHAGWGLRLMLGLGLALLLNVLILAIEPGWASVLHGRLPVTHWAAPVGFGAVITVGAASLWRHLLGAIAARANASGAAASTVRAAASTLARPQLDRLQINSRSELNS